MNIYLLYILAFYGFACAFAQLVGWLLSDDINIDNEDTNYEYY